MNPRATLTLATNNGDIGGGEVMLVRLAEAATELGLDVAVVGPTRPGDVLELAAAAGLETVALPARDRRGYLRALRRWDRRERSGLLWCNGLVPALATAGHPDRVVHLHQPPKGLQKTARRIAVRGAREVVVPSAYLGSLVPHTTVLPNWSADHGRVPPRTATDEKVLGFLGRLTLEKGVDVLAEAVDLLTREGRQVRLVLAGASRFASSRDEQVVAAALAAIDDRVTRIGWVASPREVFDRIDLAVFPSHWPEPFGLVAAEAMAAGVPFVISDAGGLREVAGTTHPWVARAGDAESLAAVIARALDTSSTERDRSIEDARRRWEAEYSPAAGRRHLAVLLERLGLPLTVPAEDRA